MSDLISRQAAIDAISKKQGGVFDQDAEIDTAVLYVYSECKAIIKDLPSVQPKIIRCKDCKWFNKPGCSIWIVDDSDKPSEDDYCSFAELRGDSEDLAHHQWVPVSERLPEKKSDVLVTISDGFNPFVDTDLWDSSRFFCYGNHRVKAWMPLPEPWKGEEDGCVHQ